MASGNGVRQRGEGRLEVNVSSLSLLGVVSSHLATCSQGSLRYVRLPNVIGLVWERPVGPVDTSRVTVSISAADAPLPTLTTSGIPPTGLSSRNSVGA